VCKQAAQVPVIVEPPCIFVVISVFETRLTERGFNIFYKNVKLFL
jgi:hypothetical protein